METQEKKKIIFSGIQPSGKMQLGNYLGAVKNWAVLQEECHCVYSIVDLHAITVRQEPKGLRERTIEAYALIMACGLDPEKSTLFIQSHVHTHPELAWILNCYTPFGELGRMTQFKSKSENHPENINAGLFTYPVLMAADILAYQADMVPVGADQKQHLELARNIAIRFNGIYGKTFQVPEDYIPKVGAKIMSLSDPTIKMSKSDPNPKGCIFVLDPKDTIIKKFKSAVTDSETEVVYREGKEGINNLLTIYSLITNQDIAAAEAEFAGKGYGDFKIAVGEAVADFLSPMQAEHRRLMADRAYLEQCWTAGAERAMRFSRRTMDKVYKKVGMVKGPF